MPNGTVRDYHYDNAGRLLRQIDTGTADSTVLLDQRYTYDALGRIVEETLLPEPPPYCLTPTTMTYDADDRVATWTSGGTDLTPAFDPDGNLTSGPLGGVGASFVYDARNRLIQAGSTTYTYDAEGRRIGQTDGTTTTTYLHDPHAPLSRLLRKTSEGVVTDCVYAGGQLLYADTGGSITVYHFDYRGSTRALSDGTGTVTHRFGYGTYGELTHATTPAVDWEIADGLATFTPPTPFLSNGAYGVQTDPNGLLHMRARYYSPDLRRFLNADPIGFAGGMNVYAFAGGDPVMGVDPSGLFDISTGVPPGLGDAMFNIHVGSGLRLSSAKQNHLEKIYVAPVLNAINEMKESAKAFTMGASLLRHNVFLDTAGDGALAFVDGALDLIPFVEIKPFESMGFYDSGRYNLRMSQGIGGLARDGGLFLWAASRWVTIPVLGGTNLAKTEGALLSMAGITPLGILTSGGISTRGLALSFITTQAMRYSTFENFSKSIKP